MSIIHDSPDREGGATCNNESLQELCGDIEYNISTIISNKRNLSVTLKLIGTEKDNTGLRNKISTLQNNSNRLASETTKHINRLKNEVHKDKRHQLCLQAEKLEYSFLEAINDYPKLQKEILDKQKKHPLIVVTIGDQPPDDDLDGHGYGNRTKSHIDLDLLLEQERMFKMEHDVTGIHTEVLDIHRIMTDLGKLVEEDGEKIDKIGTNCTAALDHVETGVSILNTAVEDINKSRKRCFILIVIIVVVIVILSIVLYCQFGK